MILSEVMVCSMLSHYAVVCVNMNGGKRLMMSCSTQSVLMAPVSESPPVTNMIHFSSLMLIEVARCSSY